MLEGRAFYSSDDFCKYFLFIYFFLFIQLYTYYLNYFSYIYFHLFRGVRKIQPQAIWWKVEPTMSLLTCCMLKYLVRGRDSVREKTREIDIVKPRRNSKLNSTPYRVSTLEWTYYLSVTANAFLFLPSFFYIRFISHIDNVWQGYSSFLQHPPTIIIYFSLDTKLYT